jgi:hypothetical protein
MAWAGVVIFAQQAAGGKMIDVLSTILLRPSFIISVLASMGVLLFQDWLGLIGRFLLCGVLIVLAIVSEPDVRALAHQAGGRRLFSRSNA